MTSLSGVEFYYMADCRTPSIVLLIFAVLLLFNIVRLLWEALTCLLNIF